MDAAIETVAEGSGVPVLLVQGGPGFSHDYLSQPVISLGRDFRVVAVADKAPAGAEATFRSSIDRVKLAIAELAQGVPFYVVAHSWGCLTLLAALDEVPQHWPRIAGGVLINPVPLEYRDFHAMAGSFRKRIPLRASLAILYQGLLRGNGEKVVQRLLPYYGVAPDVAGDTKINLDLGAYKGIMATAGAFDVDPKPELLSRFSVLRSGDDITPAALVRDITSAARRTVELAGGGHFPMLVNREPFAAALRDLLA